MLKQITFSVCCFYISTFLFSLALVATNPGVTIPGANGTYGVSLSTGEIIDHSRVDPYASTKQPRRLMISAFYPSSPILQCQKKVRPYMPPATAAVEDETYAQYGLPNQTFSLLHLTLCRAPSRMPAPEPSILPLVLFSPGLGNSRLLYSVLAQSIASAGYIVVTIDHPHDANVVEFPDGSLVLGSNISTPQQIDNALVTRAMDIGSVLTALTSPSKLPQIFQPPEKTLPNFNHSRVAVFGHSLGGATTLLAMANTTHVVGGANLDGTFFGQTLHESSTRPFLLFGHEGKNQSTDSSWKTVWPHLRGSKLELMLDGSQHATFSDFPVLAEVLGFDQIGGALGRQLEGLLGTIQGTRANRVISEIMVSFLDFVFKGEQQSKVEKTVKSFQEIKVVAGFLAAHSL